MTNPWLYKTLGYNAEKGLRAHSADRPRPPSAGGNPSIPVKTLAEFVEYAKGRPGSSLCLSGIGGSTHLANLLLQARGRY